MDVVVKRTTQPKTKKPSTPQEIEDFVVRNQHNSVRLPFCKLATEVLSRRVFMFSLRICCRI